MRLIHRFTILAIFFTMTSSSESQEWTRFRGPNGTGVSDCQTLPETWTKDDFEWEIELPGKGHSSPVLWGKKIFLLSADPEDATRHLLCVNSDDGSTIWKKEYASDPHHLHLRSSFASSTPAVDADQVYFGWSTPDETTLAAFDHDGNQQWKLNLGRWVSQHGFGTSPILYQDMVILHNSQQASQLKEGEQPGDSFMMAFDRKTGEERWRTSLVSKNVCYSVPFIHVAENGSDELICTSTGNGVFSLDPMTGKENWSIDAFRMRTVGSPIFAGGHIFGSTGSGRYSGNYVVAVKPGPNPKIAYELKNSGKFKAPYVPSLIAKGEKLFLLYDRGFASCVDAATGEIQWFNRTGAAFSGSPVMAKDRIYSIDDEGTVWVIAADENEYRVLNKCELGEESRSTPAIANGKIFFRTVSHLYCLSGNE